MLKKRIQFNLIFRIGLIITISSIALALGFAYSGDSETSALATLMSGNERFVTGKLKPKDYNAERPKLADGQHPYAIVLACADSRVSPEIVFDESLGRLFVVRTAGEVVDPVALGSIEYAVEHLHVNLLFVLGHESCGAVKATISGGDASANVKALLSRIQPAVDKVRSQGTPEKDLLNASIKENVRYQMQKSLFGSEVLSEFVHEKKLTIAGGFYNLHTGKVEMVTTDLSVERTGGKSEPETHHGHEKKATSTETEHPAEHAEVAQQEVANSKEPAKEPTKEPAKEIEVQKGPLLVAQESSFEARIRQAYEKKRSVVLKRSMLMLDGHDRCVTEDCRSIVAGEIVKLDHPMILNIMGRPQLKVRYKKYTCYILADAEAVEVARN